MDNWVVFSDDDELDDRAVFTRAEMAWLWVYEAHGGDGWIMTLDDLDPMHHPVDACVDPYALADLAGS